MADPTQPPTMESDLRPEIGKHRLLWLLDEDAVGWTFEATADERGETLVVLKLLRHSLAVGVDLAALANGSPPRPAARIPHPNLTQLRSCGHIDRHLFIVEDLVQGPTLRQALQVATAHGIPIDDMLIMAIAAQIAHGLRALHTAEINGTPMGAVHGHLHPGNILLGSDGRVRLTDYGLEGFLSAYTDAPPFDQRLGNPPYAAPEQLAGGTATPATDVFSFGLVTLQLMGSRPPFEGQSLERAIERIAEADVADALDQSTQICTAVAAVAANCLARDPGARHLDGTQLVLAMQQAKAPRHARELVVNLVARVRAHLPETIPLDLANLDAIDLEGDHQEVALMMADPLDLEVLDRSLRDLPSAPNRDSSDDLGKTDEIDITDDVGITLHSATAEFGHTEEDLGQTEEELGRTEGSLDRTVDVPSRDSLDTPSADPAGGDAMVDSSEPASRESGADEPSINEDGPSVGEDEPSTTDNIDHAVGDAAPRSPRTDARPEDGSGDAPLASHDVHDRLPPPIPPAIRPVSRPFDEPRSSLAPGKDNGETTGERSLLPWVGGGVVVLIVLVVAVAIGVGATRGGDGAGDGGTGGGDQVAGDAAGDRGSVGTTGDGVADGHADGQPAAAGETPTPQDATTEETTPEEAIPEEATSEEATSEEATPEEATPEEAIPEGTATADADASTTADAGEGQPPTGSPMLGHTPVSRGIRGREIDLAATVVPVGTYLCIVWYRGVPDGTWQALRTTDGASGNLTLSIPPGTRLGAEAGEIEYYIEISGAGGSASSGSAGAPHHITLF